MFEQKQISLNFLVLISISFFLGNLIINPTFPLYVSGMGASKFELGLLMAISSAIVIIGRIPFGIISDKIGKWPIIVFSLLVQLTSLLLYFFAPNILYLYPIRAFHTLAWTCFNPVALTLASDMATPDRRGATMGLYLTSVGLAMMAGPVINSMVIETISYRQLFLLAAVFPAFGLIILALISKRGVPKNRPVSKTVNQSLNGSSIISSLYSLIKSPTVFALSFARVTFSTADGIFSTLFAIYAANDLSIAPSVISLLFALRGATNTVMRLPAGKISDKIGRKKPIIVSYIVSVIAFLIFSEEKNFLLIALAMAFEGLAWGTRAVTEWALLGDVMPKKTSGVAMAYLSTMFEIGEGLGAILAGTLAMTMPTNAIFKIAAVILVAGIIPIGLIKTH